MGNSDSKADSQHKRNSDTNFSREELQLLELNFKSISIGKNEELDEAEFQAILSKVLPQSVSRRLCNLLTELSLREVTSGRSKTTKCGMTLKGLKAFIVEFLKGAHTAHCRYIARLASNQSESSLTGQEIMQFFTDVIEAYFQVISSSAVYKSWKDGVDEMNADKLAQSLLHELFFKGKTPSLSCIEEWDPQATFTLDEIEDWYGGCHIAGHLVSKVFYAAFRLDPANAVDISADKVMEAHKELLLPICSGADWKKFKSILSFPDILLLNQHLPVAVRAQWRYLFSTHQYGESFSQLLAKILNKGPSILLIRDKNGGVFGGFASDSWKLQPQFGGTEECFLFVLQPLLAIFHATGYNDHYMYLNIGQQTMPNGLGMGGQLEYFGLWIDNDYGKGVCSKGCTTYQCPPLCSTLEFNIDTLEVWGVGIEPKMQEEGTRSVLDKVDPELKAILEMTNKSTISDAIREEDKKNEATTSTS